MPDIDIQVTDGAWQTDSEDPQSMTRRVVGALGEHLGRSLRTRELTVRFASDDEVRALNAQFGGKDAPTNVLSFPAVDLPHQASGALGDIILARETVLREAAEQGKRACDHGCHLILHGVLHLLGYDHDTDENAEAMEGLERHVLAMIGIADPYAEHAPVEMSHDS